MDISLDDSDKEGAEQEAAFEEILRMTKGTWTKGDAAAWVRRMRRE